MKFKYANYSFMIYHEYRLGFPWLPQILYNQKIGGKILMVLTKSYTGIGKRPTLFLGIQFHQYQLAIWPIPVGNLANTGFLISECRPKGYA